jgi:hypothetical protein
MAVAESAFALSRYRKQACAKPVIISLLGLAAETIKRLADQVHDYFQMYH